MPIMLLRNLDPRAGLCNGTRLIVRRVINGRLLEAQIASKKERIAELKELMGTLMREERAAVGGRDRGRPQGGRGGVRGARPALGGS